MAPIRCLLLASGMVIAVCACQPTVRQQAPLTLNTDGGDLLLPDGFGSVIVADSLPGRARHLAVSEWGDVYVKGRREVPGGMNWVLRDTNADGKADIIRNFGSFTNEGSYSTGMRFYNGYLYTGSEKLVYRYKMKYGELIPDGSPEIIVADSGRRREHMAKPFAFDEQGFIYVPFGGPSDACQQNNRQPGSAGLRPCPLLDSNAGIWKFDANKTNQFRTKDGVRVATGLRSVVGIEWNKQDHMLYAVAHGRDGLHQTWPMYFSPWQSALLPAETFYRLPEGANAGWPYYYYDQMKQKLMLNPEYGGDGKKEAKDSTITMPIYSFPGHWGPNDLLFYTGDQFPERYKNGAFIAFHGSTIRAPYPQAGYFVAFIPFKMGKPQQMEVFADGFTGVDTVVNTSDAHYRPMGLAQGPDGSLYVAETEKGKVWRVIFKGDKKTFSEKNLTGMRAREQQNHIREPDSLRDDLERGKVHVNGEQLYVRYCRTCHQKNGMGDGNLFPPLVASEWVTGASERLIQVVLHGMEGTISVAGKSYNNVMPKFDYLSDRQLADLLSYIRTGLNNRKDSITATQVAQARKHK